jgi:hypothetical protein
MISTFEMLLPFDRRRIRVGFLPGFRTLGLCRFVEGEKCNDFVRRKISLPRLEDMRVHEKLITII